MNEFQLLWDVVMGVGKVVVICVGAWWIASILLRCLGGHPE